MRINPKLLPNKMETIFEGVGTKATDTTNFFDTATTKNPFDYDLLIISFTTNDSDYENMNVILTPKTDNKGTQIYLYATSQYYAVVAFKIATNKVQHRVRTTVGWSLSSLYIKRVQGINII